MKRVEAVIPGERMTKVSEAMEKSGIKEMTYFDTKGRGAMPIQKRSAGRGGVFTPEFNSNTSLLVVVKDSDLEKTIQAIIKAVSTGMAGEGKIFVTNVDDVVDIGTKAKGDAAL